MGIGWYGWYGVFFIPGRLLTADSTAEMQAVQWRGRENEISKGLIFGMSCGGGGRGGMLVGWCVRGGGSWGVCFGFGMEVEVMEWWVGDREVEQ